MIKSDWTKINPGNYTVKDGPGRQGWDQLWPTSKTASQPSDPTYLEPSTHYYSPLSFLESRDDYDANAAAELKRKRTFRKFSYRGVDLDALLDLSNEDFMKLVHARARRRFQRGLKRKPMGLIKKLRKAKKEAPPNEKPATVKTHLRDMIIVPEMIGSVCGVYNGKVSRGESYWRWRSRGDGWEVGCCEGRKKKGQDGIGQFEPTRGALSPAKSCWMK